MKRSVLMQIAAVSAPSVLVVLNSFGPTPPAAPDANPASVTVPVAAPAPKATPHQVRAREWADAQPVGPRLTSPLDHPVAAAPAPVATHVEPEPAPVVPDPEPVNVADPLSGLRLTALLGGRTGSLAMIDGKIFRVGDEVRPGCTLKSIDAKADRIEVSRPDGTTASFGRIEQ
jgi:hypothetical protein